MPGRRSACGTSLIRLLTSLSSAARHPATRGLRNIRDLSAADTKMNPCL
jgi:hypothetical protein